MQSMSASLQSSLCYRRFHQLVACSVTANHLFRQTVCFDADRTKDHIKFLDTGTQTPQRYLHKPQCRRQDRTHRLAPIVACPRNFRLYSLPLCPCPLAETFRVVQAPQYHFPSSKCIFQGIMYGCLISYRFTWQLLAQLSKS